jgi:hypothetical protein
MELLKRAAMTFSGTPKRRYFVRRVFKSAALGVNLCAKGPLTYLPPLWSWLLAYKPVAIHVTGDLPSAAAASEVRIANVFSII